VTATGGSMRRRTTVKREPWSGSDVTLMCPPAASTMVRNRRPRGIPRDVDVQLRGLLAEQREHIARVRSVALSGRGGEVLQALDHLRAGARPAREIGLHRFTVTVSIGCATATGARNAAELPQAAKRGGRNCVVSGSACA
jgi:hypothetical protein